MENKFNKNELEEFLLYSISLLHDRCLSLYRERNTYPIDIEAIRLCTYASTLIYCRLKNINLSEEEYLYLEVDVPYLNYLDDLSALKGVDDQKAFEVYSSCLEEIVERKLKEKSNAEYQIVPTFTCNKNEILEKIFSSSMKNNQKSSIKP